MTYRERRLAKAERLREWAAKRDAKSAASFDRAHNIGDSIPLGQPILVGRHSERHARRDQERIENGMRAGVDSLRKANEFRSRADNIEAAAGHAIYSDDDDAISRLEERVAGLEAKQARMKDINAAIRKGISLDTLNLTEREKRVLLDAARYSACKGFPGYALTNNNGNLRRYRIRLAELIAQKGREKEMATGAPADMLAPEGACQ
jgi:hypothetical protein